MGRLIEVYANKLTSDERKRPYIMEDYYYMQQVFQRVHESYTFFVFYYHRCALAPVWAERAGAPIAFVTTVRTNYVDRLPQLENAVTGVYQIAQNITYDIAPFYNALKRADAVNRAISVVESPPPVYFPAETFRFLGDPNWKVPTDLDTDDSADGNSRNPVDYEETESDNNESFATAIKLNAGITSRGNLYAGDRDYFQFAATQKVENFKISASGLRGINFRLYDDDLAEVPIEKTRAGNFQIEFEGSLQNGIYYVEIYSENNEALGDYSLLVEKISGTTQT